MNEELIEVDTNVSRFAACTPENFKLSLDKCKTQSEHSQQYGYQCKYWNDIQIVGPYNMFSASPIDKDHAAHNFAEQTNRLHSRITFYKNVTSRNTYNIFLQLLSRERDNHNSLNKQKNWHTKEECWGSVGLDQAYPVIVKSIIYYLL